MPALRQRVGAVQATPRPAQLSPGGDLAVRAERRRPGEPEGQAGDAPATVAAATPCQVIGWPVSALTPR